MGEDAGAVRREVEEARIQLGDTVEALAHKATAPRRALRDGARRLRQAPLGRAGATVLVVTVCAVGIAIARARARRR
jgi:Protein of unknown function (DUF3618)